MKSIFPTILFFIVLAHNISLGQNLSISNHNMNMLIAGLDNNISVVVENTSCDSLEVKISNGSIKGQGCSYIVNPSKIGKAFITVYKKTKKELIEIGMQEFRVIRFDQKVVLNINFGWPTMSVKEICEQQNVHLYMPGYDFDPETLFEIEHFEIEITHADSTKAFSFINAGRNLQNDVKQAFCILIPGDKIEFRKIVIVTKSGFEMNLDPTFLTIVP